MLLDNLNSLSEQELVGLLVNNTEEILDLLDHKMSTESMEFFHKKTEVLYIQLLIEEKQSADKTHSFINNTQPGIK